MLARIGRQRGIEVATTTGSFNCSTARCTIARMGFYSVTASGSPTFSNNVTWNLNSAVAATTRGIFVTTTSGRAGAGRQRIRLWSRSSSGQDIRLEDIGINVYEQSHLWIRLRLDDRRSVVYSRNAAAIFGTFSGNVIHRVVVMACILVPSARDSRTFRYGVRRGRIYVASANT